jgi:hydroxylamine reductase (hybrid-cluster protein)
MPLIVYKCNNPDCDNEITKMFTKISGIPPFLDCGSCGTGKLERQLGAPSSKSTQVVDNGVQARRTEVMNDVVEKERDRLYSEEE